jgi:hypothetical protein
MHVEGLQSILHMFARCQVQCSKNTVLEIQENPGYALSISVIAVTPVQKGESPCSDNRKFTFDLQQELMLQSYVTSDSLLSLCRLQLKSRFYAYWTYLEKVG